MIALNGFLPAAVDLKTAGMGKPISQANTIAQLPSGGQGQGTLSDVTGSFSQWIKTLMDSHVGQGPDDDNGLDFLGNKNESPLPHDDKLQLVLAEISDRSMQHLPTALAALQTDQPGYLDSGCLTVTSEIKHDGRLMPVATDDTPLQGALTGALTSNADGHVSYLADHSSGFDGEKKPPSKGLATLTQGAMPAEAEAYPPHRSNPRRYPARLDFVDATADLEAGNPHPRDASPKRLTNASVSAASAVAAKENLTALERSNPEQPLDSWGNLEKRIERVYPHPTSGQTKAALSETAASTDQSTDSSDDGSANSRTKGNSRLSGHVARTPTGDGQPPFVEHLDATTGTSAEAVASRPAFQEHLKTMAADPATNATAKDNAGPAVSSGGPESAANKAFQATVMEQIVDKATLRSLHGRSEIQIRLKPEFLGNVQMTIASEKDQLVVRILTDQPVVKEIIETHLHHLKSELTNQGVTIEKVDIMVNADGNQQPNRDQFAQMSKDQSFQNDQRQPRESEQETSHQGDGDSSSHQRPTREGVNYFA